MSTVTKRELARQVAAHASCSHAEALGVVDALFTGLREQLIEGHRIEIRGFGVLTVKETKAKPAARNPRTGERVFVPARRKVLFKPGKQLKEALTQSTP